jgi:hypothetical protein
MCRELPALRITAATGSAPAGLLPAVRIHLPAERTWRLAGPAAGARSKDDTHTSAADATSVTANPPRAGAAAIIQGAARFRPRCSIRRVARRSRRWRPAPASTPARAGGARSPHGCAECPRRCRRGRRRCMCAGSPSLVASRGHWFTQKRCRARYGPFAQPRAAFPSTEGREPKLRRSRGGPKEDNGTPQGCHWTN